MEDGGSRMELGHPRPSSSYSVLFPLSSILYPPSSIFYPPSSYSGNVRPMPAGLLEADSFIERDTERPRTQGGGGAASARPFDEGCPRQSGAETPVAIGIEGSDSRDDSNVGGAQKKGSR